LLQIARMAGLADRVGDSEWLNDADVRDEEDAEPTLRVPHYASIAVGELVSPLLPASASDPPRRRSRPLLRAALFLCAVAIVFELGWWGGSRLASQSAPPLAATKSAPMRIELHKAPHTLAPSEETQPQAPVQKPAPKFFGFLVPTPAATAAPAPKATVYDPSSL
jgi:hypothetical protein